MFSYFVSRVFLAMLPTLTFYKTYSIFLQEVTVLLSVFFDVLFFCDTNESFSPHQKIKRRHNVSFLTINKKNRIVNCFMALYSDKQLMDYDKILSDAGISAALYI